MAKRDPALLKLVREAFIILHDNTEAMNALREFVTEQQKKTPNRMRKSAYSSLKSIYLKPGSALSNPGFRSAVKRRTAK